MEYNVDPWSMSYALCQVSLEMVCSLSSLVYTHLGFNLREVLVKLVY